MKISELDIAGVFILEPEIFRDERGSFRRSFCQQTMENHGLQSECIQGNISYNPVKGTLRGFHYQEEPYGEAKTITCITGKLYDVIVDLRKDSSTYLKWCGVNLDCEQGSSLHIPRGCANAWLTLETNTIVHYYMGSAYKPEAAKGIRFDDPAFGFEWPAKIELISNKDRSYKLYT